VGHESGQGQNPQARAGGACQFKGLLTVAARHGQAGRMSVPMLPPKRKLPFAKLAIAGAVLLVVGAIVLQFVGWRTAWDEGRRIFSLAMDTIAAAGPAVFFTAMAVLPGVGAPNLAFALVAGPAFGARLGMPLVVCLGLVAITFNLTVTYWLARRWLRPLLTRLLERFGYRLPHVESGDMTDLLVLLRVTPGIPFFVQNYLLGLANVPFGRYLVISCAIQWVLNAAFMLFGDALNQGRGKMVLTAVLLLVAAIVGLQLLRKHMAKKAAA
jgi:uncharacterized membrane protein YdjX (TVP38/TMEM64 family)